MHVTLILGRVLDRGGTGRDVMSTGRPRWPEEWAVLMETLLVVGLGFVVIVAIFAKYQLLTKIADKRKNRRDTRRE